MVGNLLSGYSVEKIGRRWTLIVSNVAILVTWIATYWAPNFAVLLTARIVKGVFYGIMKPVGYLLLSEISLIRFRGSLGILNTLVINLVMLLGYVMAITCPFYLYAPRKS